MKLWDWLAYSSGRNVPTGQEQRETAVFPYVAISHCLNLAKIRDTSLLKIPRMNIFLITRLITLVNIADTKFHLDTRAFSHSI